MKCKLGDIAYFNPSERIAKGTLAKKIGMERLQPYNRTISGYEYASFSGGTKFRNGDTIMARITPCLENGKIAKVNILDENEIGFGSTEFIVFRAKDTTDEDYLYYLITSPYIRELAIKSMVGSSGRQRVQTDVVQNIEIDFPPKEEQRQIANILRALDDKIELNTRINKNLHNICSLFYEQLCQDYSYVTLDNLLSVIETGSRPKGGAVSNGIPSIGAEKIEEFGYYDYSGEKCISREYFLKLKRGIVCSGDVMLYKDGAYTGKSSMALNGFPHSECAVNEHVFLLRTENNYAQSFLYFALHNSEVYNKINKLACGKAAQPGLNQQELRSIQIKMPPKEKIMEYEQFATPLMNLISLNALNNKYLAQIRDALLPKLMSGELDVSDVKL